MVELFKWTLLAVIKTLVVELVFEPISLTISKQFSFGVMGIPVMFTKLFKLFCFILSILILRTEISFDKYLFSLFIFSDFFGFYFVLHWIYFCVKVIELLTNKIHWKYKVIIFSPYLSMVEFFLALFRFAYDHSISIFLC